MKPIAPAFINDMISASAIGRSKEESKSFNLDEPVDPFNYMLTTYPPVSLLITRFNMIKYRVAFMMIQFDNPFFNNIMY